MLDVILKYTLDIIFSEGGTNASRTYNLAKSQSYLGL